MRELIGSRLLGVGLAAGLAAVTVVLWLNGQLALYINPSSNWFAVPMAIIALVGAVISFALPEGAESDHGHDHDHGHERRGGWGTAATVTGGVLSVGVVAAIMLTPPATLSAELAMQRDTGAPPLFQGSDTVALASTGDTSKFGVGEWASVFATATNPEAFDGDTITLTGFVTPTDGGFGLTRLVITHCVIDAQPASVPVASGDIPATGTWVTVTGTIRDAGGRLQIQPASVQTVDQPKDPYEY
ncbi:TIGR03943 family protein [Microbacterium laevaniformans]|uniref:TIGR03943 family putative permease subunit n=1 Tax=Microbacterium laevaniformans TaxID=36807 RepID=UPI00195DAB0A|nr:TIGR03943 family protein [Microbacterium laevaniformans]MBM7753815.1 putative repeat protein (TIGR03943 family) [Microbacterium laevaniformans]GLJ64370.1 TIGR03943 family protein [Microbacterium laevaniformans]